MAEQVYAAASNPAAERHEGSTPFPGTHDTTTTKQKEVTEVLASFIFYGLIFAGIYFWFKVVKKDINSMKTDRDERIAKIGQAPPVAPAPKAPAQPQVPLDDQPKEVINEIYRKVFGNQHNN